MSIEYDRPLSQPLASDIHSHWLRLVLPLLVISLLIGALGVVAYRYLSEETRRETQRTLAVIAEQKRKHIEDSLAQMRTDAELHFSAHSQLEELFGRWLEGGRSESSLLESMHDRMVDLARVRGWDSLVVLDAGARPVVVVGKADSQAHAALIRDILRSPRIELVDLYLDAEERPHYGMLAPIGRPGAPAQGVVYLRRKAEQTLYPLVESWPVPTRTAETYLVRRDGHTVRFLTPLRHQHEAALRLSRALDSRDLPAALAARGERGIIDGGRDYRGVPVLAYAAAVEGTPWLMIAEIDALEAYSGIRTMTWIISVAMGLGLGLIYFVVYLLWRRDRQRSELMALQLQRAAEARFRVIFEQAPLGVALIDSRTAHIIEANRSYADIVGRPISSLTGLDPMQMTHPDDVAESQGRLNRMQRGELSGYRIKKRYLRPDGEVVWVELICERVQVEADQAPRYLAIVEDITERRQMEERLRVSEERHRQLADAAAAANAAKSEFLAHMSHEIRTPMNAVLGLTQVLEREPLNGNQRDMVVRIRSAGQSLLAILNDILDLSKIEAGQLRIEPRPFSLHNLLAGLDSLMGQAATAKGLSLKLQPPSPLPGPLLGDGLRLEQILFNLCSNAIKFTERGEVTVVVRVLADEEALVRLRFEVSDSGIGIAPEALERLFAPFIQADAGIGRRFGGTGLGLFICKRLVEMMGGSIGAHSHPGKGSTFWFELPFPRATGDEAQVRSLPVPGRTGPRMPGAHVLVVDDSAMNRDLAERALRLEGATATLAADGQQALQLLKTRPQGFDAVLMDVRMPVMDGLTAIHIIRKELGLTDLPIIAFTAGVGQEQQDAVRAAGANDMLSKPIDIDEMGRLLSKWISPRASQAGPLGDQQEPEAFPRITGIDHECAARRLGQDRTMFIELLRMFVDDNADAVEEARSALSRGESGAAARRMHTLRSNAGFICAQGVMEAAAELERAIDRCEGALEERFVLLARQIESLVEASAPWR